MAAVLPILLATLRAHPELALQLVSAILELAEKTPNLFIEVMPDGPAKDYARDHHVETLAAVRRVVDALAQNPALLTVLIRQFGPK